MYINMNCEDLHLPILPNIWNGSLNTKIISYCCHFILVYVYINLKIFFFNAVHSIQHYICIYMYISNLCMYMFTDFSVIKYEFISIYMYIYTVPYEVTVEAFGFYFLQGTKNMERNHWSQDSCEVHGTETQNVILNFENAFTFLCILILKELFVKVATSPLVLSII